MLEIDILDQNQNRASYTFSAGKYSIGRGDDCDVILNDSLASRFHGEISVNENEIFYSDKNSTNGTWIEGQRVVDNIPLAEGVELVFGDLKLVVTKSDLSTAKEAFENKDRTQVKSKIIQESEELINTKRTIHSLILEYLDLRKRNNLEGMSLEELREEASKATREIIRDRIDRIPAEISREELERQVVAEAVGLGALEPLLDDPEVTEIMVNGPDQIYVERNGRLELAESRFTGSQSLLAIIDRVVSPLGRRIDESSPMVDARLADGSRVNAIIPPLALNGPTITIRKFSKKQLYVDDLIEFGSINEDMAHFLKTAVELKQNIVISGGTGSGKTTLLNILSNFISSNERIVTIEDAAELKLNQPHVVSLESRPANAEDKGQVTIRDLVINSLRMRPDRIVVGECRGGEALDMLQAMNTGHNGSLTTGHANSPTDFLSRLEVMVMMAGVELPSRAIREQITSAVDVVVHQSRLMDGSRKVTSIVEVIGIDGVKIILQPLFEFVKTGNDEDGRIIGEYRATGHVPKFYRENLSQGASLDTSIFRETEIQIPGVSDAWN